MKPNTEHSITKPQLHEMNVERREIAENSKVYAWDSPGRMHLIAKASGMDKAMKILGYEWKDNRYQRITDLV